MLNVLHGDKHPKGIAVHYMVKFGSTMEMSEVEEWMLFQEEQCNGLVGATSPELVNDDRPSRAGKDHDIMTAGRWIDATDAALAMNGDAQEAKP